MKNFKLLFALIVTSLCPSLFSFAQEITEENYLKADQIIWEQYQKDISDVLTEQEKHPEKIDSLSKVFDRINEAASMENVKTAIKFSATPSGLQRVFMVRLDLSKDTIKSILKNLPDSMQASPYKEALLQHVESKQVIEGDPYYDFTAIDTDGNDFSMSSLEGKNILLIYGGLGCMGEEGRNYLNKLYSETSRENFEIVMFQTTNDLEELQKMRTHYLFDYPLISNFNSDYSPLQIFYGAQATPTCFFIDKTGIVKMKTIGLYQSKVNELLKEILNKDC